MDLYLSTIERMVHYSGLPPHVHQYLIKLSHLIVCIFEAAKMLCQVQGSLFSNMMTITRIAILALATLGAVSAQDATCGGAYHFLRQF